MRIPLLVVAAFGLLAGDAAAQNCTSVTPPTLIIGRSIDKNLSQIDQDFDVTLSNSMVDALYFGAPKVSYVLTWGMQAVLQVGAAQQGTGADTNTNFDELGDALGSEFSLQLNFRRTTGRPVLHTLTAHLVASRTLRVVRSVFLVLSKDLSIADQQVTRAGQQIATHLYEDLLAERILPVRPSLTAALITPTSMLAGTPASVAATLTDADTHCPAEGYKVTFKLINSNYSVYWSADATTSATGLASLPFTAPSTPGTYRVEATFLRSDGLPATSSGVFAVTSPAGDLAIAAAQVALKVGEGESVNAQLKRSSAAVQGALINFAASRGTVSSPSVSTDSTGQATINYQTPPANAVVDVTATAPPDPAAPPSPPLTATLTLVVDGQVSLDVHALGTVEGGATDITIDVSVGGVPTSAVPLTLTLTGPGQLSTTTTQTDAVGQAVVVYLAPATPASVTVTVTAVVDGQSYTKTVTIQVGAVAPPLPVIIDRVLLQASDLSACDTITNLSPGVAPPLSASVTGCGSQVNVNVTVVGNELRVDADLNEANGVQAGAFLIVTITPPRPGVLDIGVNTSWAVSTADPDPTRCLCVTVYQYPRLASSPWLSYDFTHQVLVPPSPANPLSVNVAAPIQFLIGFAGNNAAANVGHGRLVTFTFR